MLEKYITNEGMIFCVHKENWPLLCLAVASRDHHGVTKKTSRVLEAAFKKTCLAAVTRVRDPAEALGGARMSNRDGLG
jgi:hypothetical protein